MNRYFWSTKLPS